ncbi:hybrid sensor histidine kinase/response regulator [Leptospira ognonensis]|uniref:histidine kinase n=2 Tax=Leptospira ognonensis TaxID=2484945 RepID=A0A4R9K0T1_9LEPT|nr:hybrid sensor histidine kinase/response regulator [Leptospira ognonensis]
MSMDPLESHSQKKVLVVEDERIIAINICATLKQYGYDTEYLSDGIQVLEKIEKAPFDLILMDIMLGGEIDGIEVARIIKKKKDIPVIYLTAYSDESTLDRAKTTEPAGYLIKPFNSRDLYVSVEMAIYKSQIQRQLKEVQQRLYEAQKWETIGLVAAGISHEVNNPLTSIMNFSDLISREASKSENIQLMGYAKKIFDESERIAKIIKNLVNYSEATTNQITIVNVPMLLNDTRSFLHQYFLKEGIQCEIESETVPVIHCQPQKLKQVILNLLQDARSRLLSETDLEVRKIKVNIRSPETSGDKNIVVSIQDSGRGQTNPRMGSAETLDITKSILMELGGKMTRIQEDTKGCWEISLPINKPLEKEI